MTSAPKAMITVPRASPILLHTVSAATQIVGLE